jgi:DNA-binding MarR family transcriptional regulator
LIGRLHRVLRQRLDGSVRAHGLTVAQYAALSILGDQPGLSNAQLARRSFMTSQAAHQSLQALQQLGLVARTQDPQHARISRTQLTARGRRALAACERAVDQVEAEMLRVLPRERRSQLTADLKACLKVLDPSYRG